jgi:phosphoribosylformylglycinamidine cyclo-ligase
MKKSRKVSYTDAGVDITGGMDFVENIKKHASRTMTPRVLSGIGLFGALFDMSGYPAKEPVLVSSTDGVGTKIKVAVMAGSHKGVGVDIVSHCVNDIMVQGAVPLFFLDYIGCGRLRQDIMLQLIEGMSEVCVQTGAALIGGETAEMPDVYGEGEYDLVGMIVGAVDKKDIIDGRSIRKGDALIGIPSSGLHTNGFTLARRIVFEIKKMKTSDKVRELGTTIGDALLKPHICYYPLLKSLFGKHTIKGLAHITGGGLIENIPRILPADCSVEIDKKAMTVPPLFSLLQEWGPVDEDEMYRVFNMGIGLVIFVPEGEASSVLKKAQEVHKESRIIGSVVTGSRKTLLI